MARGNGIRTGGEILVDQLERHGATIAFGVPGESYLAVLDAMVDASIRFVVCRHEGGAAAMAEAVGKLTGRPGVCLVTRGPGATHAASGLHTAYQDGTPLLLLIGQIGSGDREREAFQEVDYRRTFGRMAKWVAEIDDVDRIPELVARAFATATSGRPGPVVLSLPEDVLAETTRAPDALPFVPAQAGPAPADLERMRELLARARRPLAIVGGQPWSADAHGAVTAWCEASRIPLATAWRCQDYVDNRSPAYAGHLGLAPDPGLAARLRDCDALLLVGTRLGDIETGGYAAVPLPDTGKALIHVHPAPEEIGRVFQATLPIVASGPRLAAALAGIGPVATAAAAEWYDSVREESVANRVPRQLDAELDPARLVLHLRNVLPDDAILANGAGNFSIWAHRFFEFRRYRTQLAPQSGSMGYGVPAAIAAKLLEPERTVVCITGDGDFMMTGQELATAAQYGASVVVIVFDNGMFGTIRMHQERAYPGRVSGTDLVNPDFAALAAAYGCHAERVERTEELPAALERSLGAGRPALVHVLLDAETLTPRQTLTEIREDAEAAARA
ncbi:MAG: thiamine pyrophosphate-binding protein [Actinobacteria bacterium]|nr:thiamine pyrophosphate-binding protein [Actinomycetota bacterium]